MIRKLMSLLMCAVLMFTMTGTAFADVANTADDKLAAVEVTLYGTAQTGPWQIELPSWKRTLRECILRAV